LGSGAVTLGTAGAATPITAGTRAASAGLVIHGAASAASALNGLYLLSQRNSSGGGSSESSSSGGEAAKRGLKKFAKNVNPDITVEKQLEGKGQLRDLTHNPNLVGVNIKELYKGSESGNKIMKQINKAFEGRDLGKGH
jgi:hypothetical protein